MKIRHNLLSTIIVMASVLPGCTQAGEVEFSTGLRSTITKLSKDSVVLIITPDGKSFFTDADGKLATPCKPPQLIVKNEKQIATTDKSTCTGLQKGYSVEAINPDAVIKSFPNPHGCLYCYTRKNIAGVYEQICRPTGCETKGH